MKIVAAADAIAPSQRIIVYNDTLLGGVGSQARITFTRRAALIYYPVVALAIAIPALLLQALR